MTTKHSPGPWKVVDDPAFGAYLTVETVDGRLICDLGDSDVSADEDAANARLIASAPTMYATLCDVRDFLRHSGYDTRLVDAAIKQAEGDDAEQSA